MTCKHKWMFVNGMTKRLRCTRCAELSFNLDLIDRAEDEEFDRIEQQQAQGWRKQHIEKSKDLDPYRNMVLEEVAAEFDKMPALGDTAASFAAFVRGMKR